MIIDSDEFWKSFTSLEPFDAQAQAIMEFHRVPDVPPSVRFVPDAVYGTGGGRDLRTMLFAPEDPTERRPAVVFVHGGGFLGGSPFFHLKHASELAAAGYVTAVISYRVVPEAETILGCIEDAKCAVRWMRANAASFGADPDRIAVAGDSAGGHLSAMVALTPGQFEGEGGHADVSSAVQAAVLWYPVTHIDEPWMAGAGQDFGQTPTDVFLGGQESLGKDLFPVAHAHRDAPPIFTITGDADEATLLSLVRVLHDALDAVGAPNELVVVEGRIHGFNLQPDEWPGSYARVKDFLDRSL